MMDVEELGTRRDKDVEGDEGWREFKRQARTEEVSGRPKSESTCERSDPCTGVTGESRRVVLNRAERQVELDRDERRDGWHGVRRT